MVSKIVGAAQSIAQKVNKAFTSKKGWDEHSPSKKMKKYAENYISPISTVMEKKQNNIMSKASNLARNVNTAFSSELLDYNSFSDNLGKSIITHTKTIFTTPTIVINAQDELTERKINTIIDTVNKRLGSKY